MKFDGTIDGVARLTRRSILAIGLAVRLSRYNFLRRIESILGSMDGINALDVPCLAKTLTDVRFRFGKIPRTRDAAG